METRFFAFVLGFAVMVAEIFLINIFAKYMDKFPGVKDMGEYVRTSMNKVLEISLLAGGIVAAEKNGCFLFRVHWNRSTVCNRGLPFK